MAIRTVSDFCISRVLGFSEPRTPPVTYTHHFMNASAYNSHTFMFTERFSALRAYANLSTISRLIETLGVSMAYSLLKPLALSHPLTLLIILNGSRLVKPLTIRVSLL